MPQRPELTPSLDAAAFRSHYWLKEELVSFLKGNGLPASGAKQELTERIACFLEGGAIQAPARQTRKAAVAGELTEEALIEPEIVCSEKHRAFFREKIGKSFTFNVPFQKWLKANAGKTYGEAIEAYALILAEKKKNKTTIDPQFEYNTYIRDFFAANPGRSLEEAIRCWKYRKSQPGHHRYGTEDLAALD